MGRVETFQRIKEVGIIPALRSSNSQQAIKAIEAVRLGGIDVIEISLAPDNSLAVLESVVREFGKNGLIGAGSVIDAEGVATAVAAGAQFIVTPGFDLGAVVAAKELGVAIFAGALSPTEVQVATASGAEAVKIFPCFANANARYLKALRGQYPKTNFIASGGIGLDNCAEYVRAGACAIGVGGEIVDFDTMYGGRYRVFTVRAKRLLDAVRNERSRLKAS